VNVQGVLDLIELKTTGLLAVMDEEIKMPNSSSKTMVAKFHTKFTGNKNYDKVSIESRAKVTETERWIVRVVFH
jgi:myosin heavy subunit